MKIADALQDVTCIFLDTAPIIYYVENNPAYASRVQAVFYRIDGGSLKAVTSPITLAECLVTPYRSGSMKLGQDFFDLIVHGNNTAFTPINDQCARQAAEMRARYNLTLADALQVSVALIAGCQALLTNDAGLKRVTEMQVIVIDDLE